MCGIVGYSGRSNAAPILLATLERLEYRGYDSCGIAVANAHGLEVHKDTGTVQRLQAAIPSLSGTIGIGHTRWATVGAPSRENAHPHLDCTGRIAVVHNGHLDNFQAVRKTLAAEGHHFSSQTDSEVIAHLVEKFYRGDLLQALRQAVACLEGSYALIVLHRDHTHLAVARKESPLVVAQSEDGTLVASDAAALVPYSSLVMYLEDGDVGLVSPHQAAFWRNGEPRNVPVHRITWKPQDVERATFPHFMLKEIHEQPRVLRECLQGLVSGEKAGIALELDPAERPPLMLILGCGTSYHACLFFERFLGPLVSFPIKAQVASEFQPGKWISPNTLAIVLTQSGETADSLTALRWLTEANCRTVAVTNVEGSSATRIAQHVLLMRAGPEMSVAATKTFTAQLLLLYLLGFGLASQEGTKYGRKALRPYERLLPELRRLPGRVQQVIERSDKIKEIATHFAHSARALYVTGRGLNYPIALEGALKLKEICYLPAEGYAAGELKHGPFALLDAQTPVIALLSHDEEYKRMVTTIQEVRARSAPIVLIAPDDEVEAKTEVDVVLPVPVTDPVFSPLLHAVTLQLYAYYTAAALGRPIDRPRNLAKSVTVL